MRVIPREGMPACPRRRIRRSAKTPGLAEAFAQNQDKSATADAGAVKQASSRGAVTFYTDPDAHQLLRMLGVESGQSTQTLMTEALNALFAKHGKPPIA